MFSSIPNDFETLFSNISRYDTNRERYGVTSLRHASKLEVWKAVSIKVTAFVNAMLCTLVHTYKTTRQDISEDGDLLIHSG